MRYTPGELRVMSARRLVARWGTGPRQQSKNHFKMAPLDCGHAQCHQCHGYKLAGRPRPAVKRANIALREQLAA